MRKTRKSPRKSARKTKRSYRWGGETIKISELSDANDWQKDAFDEYRDYIFNMFDNRPSDPNPDYKYSKNGHVAYFTTIINGRDISIVYHPPKSETDETIDRSRTINMWVEDDQKLIKARKYWLDNIKANPRQPGNR